ncbi:hypothetical protein C9374_011258 [Naegleria lovaniensis]|uniref:Uncharacterized protein n=1 Tax=Naegleria lovaniensis TaxID=51637 RepID=A0AA88H0H1_NAELO|nr:uncharacterized protein C9374_011258 [Naegleria lovaniensis]KAG2392533.1 hypothetical protein C9374_011258 [Naegleria lovaniensis]
MATPLSDYPPILKPLVPYLQRANEFEKRAPIVSFYCRTYAVQLGISIVQSQDQSDDEATQILTDLMDRLEQDKEQLNIEAQESEAKDMVEMFALKVFKKADDADREGRHDTQIAKLYYAASILIEVTKQFGDLSSNMVEKQKYAKWRAAEIQKSIRTGQPVPPVEDQQAEDQDDQLQYYSNQQINPTSNQSSEEDEVNRYLQEQENQLAKERQPSPSYDWNSSSQQQTQFNYQPQQPSQKQQNDYMNVSPTTSSEETSFQQPKTFSQLQQQFSTPPPPWGSQQQPKQETSLNPSPTFNTASSNSIQPSSTSQQLPKPTIQQQRTTVSPPSFSQPSHTTPPPPQQHVTSHITSTVGGSKDIPLDNMMKAQKLCKFAISSLQFEDVETARKNLIEALNLIS